MAKSKKKLFQFAAIACALVSASLCAACDKGGTPVNSDRWTIVLDFNDEVSRDGKVFVEKSQSVELPTDFFYEGHTFAGWKTQTGEDVPAVYTPTANTTLVAVWTTAACTVTFDDNYQGGSVTEVPVNFGGSLTDIPEVTREGYKFRYWSTSPEGSRVDLSSYEVTGDTTFYAIWIDASINIYMITFDCGKYDGAPSPTDIDVEQGKTIKKSNLPSVKRTGYKLEGWTTSAPTGDDWTIDSYPATNVPKLITVPYTPKKDLTLYAVWTIQQYTVVFNANYTDSPYNYNVYESSSILSNEAVSAPKQNPERENYTFMGWYTAGKGGTKVDFEKGVHVDSNAGYYAHWKHNGLATDVFHAEYVEFDPSKPYYGYSGNVVGANCIVKDGGTVGTVVTDNYPTNSVLKGGSGYYVSYQYEQGDTLRFEITASKATNATLVGSFAVENGNVNKFAPTGDNATLIKVNGTSVDYSLTLSPIFGEYTIGQVSLKEGVNVIEIVVNNSNKVMGGTYRAVGFMTDYIKFTNYGDAKFTWSPIYDNLEGLS